MKKIIIFLFSNLFLATLVFGQKGALEISLNSGFNYSNFRYVNVPDGDYYIRQWKPSFRYGIGIKKKISSHFNIGMEINMEEKGWLETNIGALDTSVGVFGQGKANFYYPFLSIPIFLDYEVQFKKIAWLVEGGILNNIRRSGGVIIPQYPGSIVLSVIEPSYSPIFDIGLSYGTGAKFNIYKNWNINLIGRYAFSLNGVSTWGLGKKNLRHKNYTGLVALSYSLKITLKPYK